MKSDRDVLADRASDLPGASCTDVAHGEHARGAGLEDGTGLDEFHLVDGILEECRIWVESDDYEDDCRIPGSRRRCWLGVRCP